MVDHMSLGIHVDTISILRIYDIRRMPAVDDDLVISAIHNEVRPIAFERTQPFFSGAILLD